jgi:alpha-L-fucosidase
VQLPARKPCDYAVALKITGTDLRGFKPELAVPTASAVVQPDAYGKYVLAPDTADLHGSLREEAQGGRPNIGFWDNPQDWASWKVNFQQPGKFRVMASSAALADSSFTVEAAGQKLPAQVPATGAWDKFERFDVGTLEIKQAGEQPVNVRPSDPQTWKAINLRSIVLVPTK